MPVQLGRNEILGTIEIEGDTQSSSQFNEQIN